MFWIHLQPIEPIWRSPPRLSPWTTLRIVQVHVPPYGVAVDAQAVANLVKIKTLHAKLREQANPLYPTPFFLLVAVLGQDRNAKLYFGASALCMHWGCRKTGRDEQEEEGDIARADGRRGHLYTRLRGEVLESSWDVHDGSLHVIAKDAYFFYFIERSQTLFSLPLRDSRIWLSAASTAYLRLRCRPSLVAEIGWS